MVTHLLWTHVETVFEFFFGNVGKFPFFLKKYSFSFFLRMIFQVCVMEIKTRHRPKVNICTKNIGVPDRCLPVSQLKVSIMHHSGMSCSPQQWTVEQLTSARSKLDAYIEKAAHEAATWKKAKNIPIVISEVFETLAGLLKNGNLPDILTKEQVAVCKSLGSCRAHMRVSNTVKKSRIKVNRRVQPASLEVKACVPPCAWIRGFLLTFWNFCTSSNLFPMHTRLQFSSTSTQNLLAAFDAVDAVFAENRDRTTLFPYFARLSKKIGTFYLSNICSVLVEGRTLPLLEHYLPVQITEQDHSPTVDEFAIRTECLVDVLNLLITWNGSLSVVKRSVCPFDTQACFLAECVFRTLSSLGSPWVHDVPAGDKLGLLDFTFSIDENRRLRLRAFLPGACL